MQFYKIHLMYFNSLWEEVSMRQQKQPCEPGKHVLVHELMKFVAKKRDLGISLQLLPCTTLHLHYLLNMYAKYWYAKLLPLKLLPSYCCLESSKSVQTSKVNRVTV